MTEQIRNTMTVDVKANLLAPDWAAKRRPSNVRNMRATGREIASYGYSHELIYRQTRDIFRQKTVNAKNVLEDAIGVSVKGHRSANVVSALTNGARTHF